MTNGGFVFFKNNKDKNFGIKKLNSLYCYGKKIFILKIIKKINYFIK